MHAANSTCITERGRRAAISGRRDAQRRGGSDTVFYQTSSFNNTRKKKNGRTRAWVFLRRNTNTTFGIVHFFFYRDSLREEKKEQTGN